MDSTSRVKIEYTDPFDISSSFVSELLPKFPLRDLHWSSSSRPIRSIESLNVELVSDERSKLEREQSLAEGSRDTSDNAPTSKTEGSRKERRHQIPGLESTPYLKIYLLCCNDVENYKSNTRRQLRDWVKEHTASSYSTPSIIKQDNHNASEWLIIHIVPTSPDGPTSTSQIPGDKSDGNPDKRSSSSRWPSRNSTSVIEKLRSDFNATSKNALDRVIQVHLAEISSEGAPQADRRTQDRRNEWNGLIFRMKTLILASFDLRVSQYEEDIREREGQKQIFGWNFNTFFVLKEALAMGFENMGLLEDSLAVYQELDVVLHSVLEEQQVKGSKKQTAHFIDYTEDLYEAFTQAVKLTGESMLDHSDISINSLIANPGSSLLNTERKPFRDMILSNRISILDFQSYVFARQTFLSLRLANVSNKDSASNAAFTTQNGQAARNTSDLSHVKKPKQEDFVVLAQVVRSSIDFVTATAPVVRQDIVCAAKQSAIDLNEPEESMKITQNQAIENFVASWIFSASQCVIEATSIQSLTHQLDYLLRQSTGDDANLKIIADTDRAAIQIDSTYRKDLPARTSSLPANNPTKSISPLDQTFSQAALSDADKIISSGNSPTGFQDYAAGRGDLLALRRRVLSELGLRNGSWQGDIAHMVVQSGPSNNVMQEIKLERDLKEDKIVTTGSPACPTTALKAGVCNMRLLSALNSSKSFYEEYESLTRLALAHYVAGNRGKAAESMIVDLAVAYFQSGNYTAAASNFRRLAPSLAKNDWIDLEIVVLGMYAECLKQLKEDEEYVRTSLKLLAKSTRNRFAVGKELKSQLGDSPPRSANHGLSTILATSKSLLVEMSVSMNDYFDSIELSRHVQHCSRHDGFDIILKIRSLIPEEFQGESVRACIVCKEGDQYSEIWLAAKDAQPIRPGMAQIVLTSMVMQPGWYVLDKVHILSSKIRFVLDLSPTAKSPLFPRIDNSDSYSRSSDSSSPQSLMVWPRPGSLNARLEHYEIINLEQQNSVKIVLMTGQNIAGYCKLSLRAASAGLRLHTADAESLGGEITIVNKSQAGTITLDTVSANIVASIKIPYSTETELQEINARITIEYETAGGNCALISNTNLPIFLPLAINVQDFFKQGMLLSKFTIGTSSKMPVRISSCRLEGNRDFRTISPHWTGNEVDVFVRQPLSLISKIHRNPPIDNNRMPLQNKLFLKVNYRCLDEDIYDVVEKKFVSTLETKTLRTYSRVLIPALIKNLKRRVAAQDLERICILRELKLGVFEDWDWSTVLGWLPLDDGEEIEKWLRDWHEVVGLAFVYSGVLTSLQDNQTITLERNHLLSATQCLTVPVEIPQLHVLHTACLRRRSMSLRSPPTLDTIPLGEGAPADLTISHTREWVYGNFPVTADEALRFGFEVYADPGTWIIGGQRKGHFSSRENETTSFALLLYPQKAGHLLLPSLEIRMLPPMRTEGEDQRKPTVPATSCEVDYQNLGESILVVPDLLSTTVSLDPSGSGEGWLVDSKRRGS